MRLMVSEIINNTATLKTEDEQINYLRSHDSLPLRHVLKAGYCKTIECLLPPGDPPYRPTEAVESQGMFFANARKMYLFFKGGNDNLNQLKRETLFIQLLESVHPDDAKMLLLMKDKKLPLNPGMVAKAFPDLQIDPIEKIEPVKPSVASKIKTVFDSVLPKQPELKEDVKVTVKPKGKRGRKKKESSVP